MPIKKFSTFAQVDHYWKAIIKKVKTCPRDLSELGVVDLIEILRNALWAC